MNILVAGSRTFENYDLVKRYLDTYLFPITTIISGGAYGADMQGEHYAYENGIVITRCIPAWDYHGKKAGFLRNKVMSKLADEAFVFWDGESRGTEHMLNLLRKEEIPTTIVEV